MKNDLKRLFKTSSVYLIGNVANRIGAFILLPLYTHQLSVQQYGVLELIYSTISMISVLLSLGLSHATLRFYFDYKNKKDQNAVITTNLVVMAALSACGILVLLFYKEPLASFILNDANYAPVLIICSAIIAMELTAEILLAYLRAKEWAFLFVGVAVLRLVVQLSMSWFFLVIRNEAVLGVLKANLASICISWAITFVVVIKNCGFSFDRKMVIPILKYSLPFALGGIIAVARESVIDRFLLKEFVSMEAVGVYGLAAKFSSLLGFLLAEPFNRSYGAFRFTIIREDNSASIQSMVVHYLFVGATFLSLGISIFAPDIIKVMATTQYVDAAQLVPILLVGSVGNVLTYCFQTGILYSKETKQLFKISLGSAVFGLSANYVLIQSFGIVGAAISFSLTQLLISWWTNWKSQKFFPVQYPICNMLRIGILGICIYWLNTLWELDSIGMSIVWKLTLVCLFLFSSYCLDSGVKGLYNKASQLIKEMQLN
jgi:O-antigen/teichoic acid export membrane protein